MLEAANRSSRAVNADFVKAVVVFRDDLDDETWEQLKTPTTTVQLDLAGLDLLVRRHDVRPGRAGSASRSWSTSARCRSRTAGRTPVDEVAYEQVVEPMSRDVMASTWAVSVESGLAINQALLAAVSMKSRGRFARVRLGHREGCFGHPGRGSRCG
ncbi:MAG: hypothetical protein U0S48_11090 [Solirubrobacteraceae bacterium]